MDIVIADSFTEIVRTRAEYLREYKSRAGKKIFITYHASPDHPQAIIFKPEPEEDEALRHDDRFFVPPYWTKWLALDVGDGQTDWTEVAELVEGSYRQVALKRMLTALDAEG